MKRILFFVLAAALCISLVGCAKTGSDIPQDLDLQQVYQTILDAQKETEQEELVLLEETSDDLIENYYVGLKGIELKQRVLYMAPITGFACEVMLVEVADSKDVQAVEDIFNARINLGGSDEFYAETSALWKANAKVQTLGNYVAMVVFPDGYVIPDNVFKSATAN